MSNKKTREQIQPKALLELEKNNYTGSIILSTGTGKSKVAIDAIKKENFKNILITSPRTNLKENWKKELEKWGISQYRVCVDPPDIVPSFEKLCWMYDDNILQITIENIQTCYKWDEDRIKAFDLIIFDEIHTMATEQYGRPLRIRAKYNLPRIGLTATPDNHKDDKDIFYKTYCPIVYEYLDSAKDGIINGRKYFIYEYQLTDDYQVLAGTKKKPFLNGEASQYEYLSNAIKKGQVLMSRTGSQDWFKDAANWGWKNQGTPAQKSAAIQYLNAIKYRKEFLWNLTSSADIATKIKKLILDSQIANKVLLFSELTKQAEKLSEYTVHSNNSEALNAINLHNFDKGVIRQLASCNSLTLGLNIKGANHAIMESYSGSSTGFIQKSGR